jgi:DNA repair photolyase
MSVPAVSVDFEPRFCGNHVVDLTAGCSFGCIYCPFSDIEARRQGAPRPTAVDMAQLQSLPAPPTVFLSPASDPFAPQAASKTHQLLEHLLPRGTIVGILTKGTIPQQTLDLLASYPKQVEGIVVGLTSLDEARNRILEPGCPSATQRLETLAHISDRGLIAALRLDPLFPSLDDSPASLERLLDEAAARNATGITATYVFAWGRYLRRLREEPMLTTSVGLLNERSPMEGGTAFSVSLGRKLETYSRLAHMSRERGLRFSTCGCKDLRVRAQGSFDTTCRNSSFLDERQLAITRSGGCRVPAGARPDVPPDIQR